MSRKERFFNLIEIKEEKECWPWTGCCFPNGYGRFLWKTFDPMINMGAHKASWLINVGKIPDNLCVLHKCDNVVCVNPNHLFLGTNKDNTHDAMAKGRMAKGSNHYKAKLSEEDVSIIKKLLAREGPQYRIADIFHVSCGIIAHILLILMLTVLGSM